METPIILLQERHLKAVCALETLCFSSPWDEEQFKDALYSSHFRLYGYFENELLLAYLLISKVEEYCEIINIATNPNHRNKGYAFKLLDSFFKQDFIMNTQTNILLNTQTNTQTNTQINTQTILEVRSQNIAAQNLYKKFGFIQIHTRKGYYKDNGDDAFVMERRII